jgi:hypothetical protein
MREFMLVYRPQAGMNTYGVTLTIPGPVLPPDRAKLVFESFCREFERAGYCAVWRLEIQERGALHWHLIAGAPSEPDVAKLWHDAIRTIGYEVFDPPLAWENYIADLQHQRHKKRVRQLLPGEDYKGMKFTSCSDRMFLPGAVYHAVNVQSQGDRGSWLRYMQDHTSKAKQEQVAVGVGRHWGVIGRKRFVSTEPKEYFEMTDSQKARYLRMHQRLATSSEKKKDSPFGRRLQARIRRGFRGTSTWFGNSATITRMVDWVMWDVVPRSTFLDYIRSRPDASCDVTLNQQVSL